MSDTPYVPTMSEVSSLSEASLDDLIRLIREQLDRMRQDGLEIERLKLED